MNEEARNLLETIIEQFSIENFNLFFRRKTTSYREIMETSPHLNDEDFSDSIKLGEIKFDDMDRVIVFAFQVKKELSERSGKKAQYEKAKSILKIPEHQIYSAGIFIYYDLKDRFRFSLIYPESIGTRRLWNNFRRFTYFVSSEFTNKTFKKQIGDIEFKDYNSVRSAFSITAVTDLFYTEFFDIYQKIVVNTQNLNKIDSELIARDFILLFAIRSIFLGFIQKKSWLGNNERFMQDFFREYKNKFFGNDQFYSRWLTPLFFEALNSPPYTKVAYGNNDFSPETEAILQTAPFLNGGLFREKHGFDDNGWIIKDSDIKLFYDFLFSHSFTIEENSLEDEDLQLNPEFLGIIFERLVNKANGAVYTPRTEVDLMCRLSLLKWLQKNLESNIRVVNLYELFFKESENIDEQKEGSFSKKEVQEILDKLQNITICDPAVGSGAFLVGLMQVIDEVEESLRNSKGLVGGSLFERKKEIIKNSLYGVEVKEWAVWVCQLRLWLSLFVETPDDLKDSLEPILPNLDFKVRQGDSLVQRVASKTFPVSGQIMFLTKSIKDKITKLKNLKREYYDNKSSLQEHDLKVEELRIYEEIIGEEIKTLKQSLIRLLSENDHGAGKTLFEEEMGYIEKKTDLYEQKAKAVREKIADLEEQKQALHSGGKPLVWGIEFAEIFTEKQGFDIVIGNPPYVRQEIIADPTGKIKDKSEYKKYLQEMLTIDFRHHFKSLNVSAKSDLYTYFYVRSLRLLNPGGIHTFICSNSWLDVEYGAWLQEFLLESCPIDIIIDNHAKRSFGSADVNTIISIIHAPVHDSRKHISDDHLIKFVAFKVPFEEAIFTENMLQIEQTDEIISNDLFRIFPIKNMNLKEAGMEYEEDQVKTSKTKYIGDKWGSKFLIAPDLIFSMFINPSDRLVYLKDVYYHSQRNNLSVFKNTDRLIRQEGALPFLSSIKDIRKIKVLSTDLLYSINGTNEEYIEMIEPDIISNRFLSDRMFFIEGDKFAVSDTFFILKLKKQYKKWFISALLNSTISLLITEIMGRKNLGGGLLTIYGYELKKMYIIDPDSIKVTKDLYDLYTSLSTRSIKSIFEECGIEPRSGMPIEEQKPNPLPDRAELDKIVFDALNLTEEERKEVYRAVCRLVWNRISKANSV